MEYLGGFPSCSSVIRLYKVLICQSCDRSIRCRSIRLIPDAALKVPTLPFNGESPCCPTWSHPSDLVRNVEEGVSTIRIQTRTEIGHLFQNDGRCLRCFKLHMLATGQYRMYHGRKTHIWKIIVRVRRKWDRKAKGRVRESRRVSVGLSQFSPLKVATMYSTSFQNASRFPDKLTQDERGKDLGT
jgi:hypothetical protein